MKRFNLVDSFNQNVNNSQIAKVVYFCFSAFILISWLLRVIGYGFERMTEDYQSSYGLTEFLINYEGGFVRRGLLGQCLIWLCRLTSTQPNIWIFIISAFSFFSALIVFLYYFKKRKFCWWLIFSSFLFFFVNGWVRKDFISYNIIIIITLLVHDNEASFNKKLIASLLSALGILFHEAFIFYGVPILTLLLLRSRRSISEIIYLLAIPTIVFMASATYRGNDIVVNAIIDSWNQIIPNKPLNNFAPCNSILALNWKTIPTFKFHISLNFGGYWNNYGIFGSVLIQIFNAIASYYLILNFLVFYNRTSTFSFKERNNLSALYLMNGFCLLPMFTVLSCDNGRVYQYLWMATLIPFMIISSEKLSIIFGTKVTRFISTFNRLFDTVFRPNRWVTLIVFLFIGIPLASVNLIAGFKNSIVGWIVFLIDKLN